MIASVIVGDIILVSMLLSIAEYIPDYYQTYRIWVVWDRKIAMIIFPTLCTMAYAGI